MVKMMWTLFDFKGEGSSEQRPATAGTEQEEEGPLKKRRAHRGMVFFFALGQCVEYNMADHHIPLTHMVWIWGRMDCPDG